MVKPKKYLGQHFLKDTTIAERIASGLSCIDFDRLVEIGPGTGVLTKFLLPQYKERLMLIELDKESVDYLSTHFSLNEDQLLFKDVLKLNFNDYFDSKERLAVIGNFPYNISSQIFFKILEHVGQVDGVVCMLQKEVAERLASPPGSKRYGILSVLLQTFYTIEYLFTVPPDVFIPPPKVDSGVIRLIRNERKALPCDWADYKRVVKQGFQNRRKTLRNALKPLNLPAAVQQSAYLNQRAEQLSVEDFINLTNAIESGKRI